MPPATTSCRDRTSEFQAIADRLKRSPAFAAANGSVDGSSRAGPQAQQQQQQQQAGGSLHSEFNRRASQIGLSIHQTSNKLHKLTQLAKKTSIFDDPAVEIQELTAVIRQDIQALNSAIEDLQRVCDARNEGINRNKHSSDHSATVVGTLKTKLMDTTKEFKDVLTLRSESLRVHEERMKIYSSSSDKRTRGFGKQVPNGTTRELFNSRGVTDGMPKATHLRRRPGGAESSTSQASSSFSGQSQAQTQQLVPTQDHYLHSRAEALRNVESTIAELSNIFTQLATMVAEQGEVAIRIDENMDDTLSNVDAAQNQLLKYLNGISSNRWLIVKIFFVLLIFLLVFVFFVA